MLSKLIKDDIKKKEGGFTIVEVMIVLAIAGLILAIVFLAIPALQQRSRNSQRQADIGAIKVAIDQYSATAANSGKIPTTQTELEAAFQLAGKFAYYTEGALGVLPTTVPLALSGKQKVFITEKTATLPAISAAVPDTDIVHIFTSAKCLATQAIAHNAITAIATTYTAGGANVLETGGARAYAIVYAEEGQDILICQDNS